MSNPFEAGFVPMSKNTSYNPVSIPEIEKSTVMNAEFEAFFVTANLQNPVNNKLPLNETTISNRISNSNSVQNILAPPYFPDGESPKRNRITLGTTVDKASSINDIASELSLNPPSMNPPLMVYF